MNTIYDLIIIGGGPAGVGAGVYASRKQLRTLFLTVDFHGQSSVSEGIENWIGTVKISGEDLSKSLENHLKAYAGEFVDIKTGAWVSNVESVGTPEAPLFRISVKSGSSGQLGQAANVDESGAMQTFEAKSVLVTTGSTRRRLPAIGADIYEHKGVTYCATCDGPIFSGQDVAVIGGGNAAFESAAQLAAYCKSVTIVNRRDVFRADPVTVAKVSAKENVKLLTNVEVVEVKGAKFANALAYKENGSEEIKELPVTGIFVEIGLIPNTSFLKDVVVLDEHGKVIVDPKTQQTRTPGIWAAGDCTDGLYHQNNIAVGDAVKALEDIYINLAKR